MIVAVMAGMAALGAIVAIFVPLLGNIPVALLMGFLVGRSTWRRRHVLLFGASLAIGTGIGSAFGLLWFFGMRAYVLNTVLTAFCYVSAAALVYEEPVDTPMP
jgi:hypothetical protein